MLSAALRKRRAKRPAVPPSRAAFRRPEKKGLQGARRPWPGRRPWKGKGPARRLRAIVRGAAFPNAFRRSGERGRKSPGGSAKPCRFPPPRKKGPQSAALGRAGGPKGKRPWTAASRHSSGRGVSKCFPPPRKKGPQGAALGRAVGPKGKRPWTAASRHRPGRGVPKCFPPPLDGRRPWKGKGPARRLRAIVRGAAFPDAFRRPEKKGAKRPAVPPSRAAFPPPRGKGRKAPFFNAEGALRDCAAARRVV